LIFEEERNTMINNKELLASKGSCGFEEDIYPPNLRTNPLQEGGDDDLSLALGPIKGQSLCFSQGRKSFKTTMGLKDSKCLSHGLRRTSSFLKVH